MAPTKRRQTAALRPPPDAYLSDNRLTLDDAGAALVRVTLVSLLAIALTIWALWGRL